jgi:hypothetical protein
VPEVPREQGQDADGDELRALLEQFKLADALAALREYGVGCVEDLRELEPSEIAALSLNPISKKKMLKLMLHLGVPGFVQGTMQVTLSLARARSLSLLFSPCREHRSGSW